MHIMHLSYHPLVLELKHPFRIATGMRTHTNAMRTCIRVGAHEGLGEAVMVPYYGENHETASTFLAKAAALLHGFSGDFSIASIMGEVDAIASGNHAAKAAVDIALHNLWSDMTGHPLWELLGSDPEKMPPTSFTLGIDTPEVLRQKMAEAADFQVIKIKIGTADDRSIIRTIREITDKPIYADANQGWTDREAALDLVHWLQAQGVVLIEQPFLKTDLAAAAWLTARSPLPVFADESFQRLSDLPAVADCFHGLNIKLMKCTGLHEGQQIVRAARARHLKLMIGCMTETPCGILAAAALAPQCDFADLDGCWLVKNNPLPLPDLREGRVWLPHFPS